MKKIIGILTAFLILSSPALAAWDKTKPGNNEKLKDAPAQIRANWDAIEAGTEPALQITDAKVSSSAAIADTKLANITTAGKVSGAALTSLGSTPSGAGVLPLANGGTNANLSPLAGSLIYSTTTALAKTNTAAAGAVMQANGSSAPAFSAWTMASPGTTGNALISDGTNWTSAALTTGGNLLAVNAYSSNDTWARPSGCTKALVYVVGGGGGGSGANVGGGGGGVAVEWITSGLASSETVTVGGGGAGGTSGNNGNNGATSSFGAFCSASGGTGGQGSGGDGGTGSGGSINFTGQKGGFGQSINISGNNYTYLGAGGASALGFGFGGPASGLHVNVSSYSGDAGVGFGGGGGGSRGTTGGGGSSGLVIVYSYS